MHSVLQTFGRFWEVVGIRKCRYWEVALYSLEVRKLHEVK